MGFDPEDEQTVEKLSYNFTKFGGASKDIPEPSDDQMLEFWRAWLAHLELGRSDRETIPKLLAEKGPEDQNSQAYKDWSETRDDKIQELVTTTAKRGMEAIERRREIIAAVCSQQPSMDELRMLPYRIFNAFEGYVMRALSPEGLTTALNF